MNLNANRNFLLVILLNYNILNIKRILNDFISQTSQDYKIIAANNNSDDLSYEICKLYERTKKLNIECKDFGNIPNDDKIYKCLFLNKNYDIVQVVQSTNIDAAFQPNFISHLKQIVESGNFINWMSYDVASRCFINEIASDAFNEKTYFLTSNEANRIYVSQKSSKNSNKEIKNERVSSLVESINNSHAHDGQVALSEIHKDCFDIFISVIVTSYNYGKFISQTLDSLVNQTYKNFEVIVVDDGSSDDSLRIIEEYVKQYDFIHLYTHDGNSNKGLPETTKLGVLKSKGEYIAFCESDDMLDENNLLEKARLIDKYNKTPTIVINDIQVFGDQPRANRLEELSEYRKSLFNDECNVIPIDAFYHTNLICTFSSCIVKRDALLKCNYNTPYQAELDWWLWYQIMLFDNRIFFIDKKLTRWRAHQSFISTSHSEQKQLDFIEALSTLHASTQKSIATLNLADNSPEFSIVMPTYNRRQCIKTAIDSVLNQTYDKFELLIVDDGSTDGTEEYVKQTYQQQLDAQKIRYFKTTKAGVSHARNIGLKNSRNEWICYLDTDDYYDKSYLSYVSSAIMNNPGYLTFILQTELTKNLKQFDYDQLIWLNYIQMESFIHHRKIFEDLGGFDQQMKRLVDWDMEIRYTAKYPAYYITSAYKLFTVCTTNSSNRITDNHSILNKSFNMIRNRYCKNVFPTVTTIITSYNNQKYLKQAIESALDQKGRFVHEIIISDDGSTDGSQKIIREYAREYDGIIRDLSEKENVGIAKNLKRCIKAATGKYIAILESDDYWTDRFKLRHCQEFLERHPCCNMVFTKLKILNEFIGNSIQYMPIQDTFPPELTEDNMFNRNSQHNCIFNLSTVFCDAELMKKLPEEDFFTSIFSEIPLALYFFQHGKIGYIGKPYSIYRRHDSYYSGRSSYDKLKFSLDNRKIALNYCSDKNKKELLDEIRKKETAVQKFEMQNEWKCLT